MQRIRRTIQSSLHLIQALMELARAESGQTELEFIDAEVAELADRSVDDFRARATSAGLGLEVRTHGGLTVRTDPVRVRQILSNLLSNAVKYTREGRVDVEARRVPDGDGPRPGDWIAVRVTDTGPGIPPEKQEAVFEEFTRLDPEAPHGAGVGLAISRRIAHRLGADITLQSEVGRGSTFTLWLPAGPTDPAEDEIASER